MNPLKKATELVKSVQNKSLVRAERAQMALELAAHLLEAAHQQSSRKEKQKDRLQAKMMHDPNGRALTTALTDQCFRSRLSPRIANQLVFLIKKYHIPHFLNESDRMKFLVFRLFGNQYPSFFTPMIKKQIKKEMSAVLLPDEIGERSTFFRQCKKQNILVNLNHLGEAVLGEQEASRRLQSYLQDLADPDIEYISVKISTIFSQINMIGWEKSAHVLAERLRLLYREAQKHGGKFVNLDMEEYKDLELTVEVFQTVLSENAFSSYYGGIALQSYLPDSFEIQKKLTSWAKTRKGPIKIRLVKGANLSMEQVDSSLHNWELAPYKTKVQSDANFKRMLEYAVDHLEAVHLGIGSHNLFDIAYALILKTEVNAGEQITFEMLEGMSPSMQRVVQKLTHKLVLYCPETKEQDYQNAIAYLLRRLEENCGEEHFLRHFFDLKVGNATWNSEAKKFQEACKAIDTLDETRHRKPPLLERPLDAPFKNAPDTDFSLKENQLWAESIYKKWEAKTHGVIGKKHPSSPLQKGIDPSHPDKVFYQYSVANTAMIDQALDLASSQQTSWEQMPFEERSKILGKAANLLRQARGDLIGAMIADGGKTIWEADPEISEGIDFIDYYRKNWEKFLSFSDMSYKAKGVVLVAPPWNFPLSIPVGGIAAALTAGNAVLFKPAPEAVLVGWHFVQLFWQAGVPKEVLQFIPCEDDPVGSYLIKHPKLATVLLTGSTQTAQLFMQLRPDLDLHAETGGKNSLIITAMSDRDLAVRDLVHSAFSHSGQKCSACSLAIVESEVYDDPNFHRQLRDAAKSLTVAGAWDPSCKITPLIHPPTDPLLRGLTTLEPGEQWLLEPKADPNNPHLWSPGIKIHVQKGSFTHQTEFFGPLLAVVRAENLEEAIQIANQTPYGLTAGLHSLDEREHAIWKQKIVAGNLYINRGITGAIVRRQPFGGCKASSFGPTSKAGGPNYVCQLVHATQKDLPNEKGILPGSIAPLISGLHLLHFSEEEKRVWKKSAESYAYWAEVLKEAVDPSCVTGQSNLFYHISYDQKLIVRMQDPKALVALLQVIAACLICKTEVELSIPVAIPAIEKAWIKTTVEGEKEFIARMKETKPSRVRLIGKPSIELQKMAAGIGASLHRAPVLANGRFELLHYLREVAVSHDVHRYGYIPDYTQCE